MADSKVETLSRLARWRINSFETAPSVKSSSCFGASYGSYSSSSHGVSSTFPLGSSSTLTFGSSSTPAFGSSLFGMANPSSVSSSTPALGSSLFGMANPSSVSSSLDPKSHLGSSASYRTSDPFKMGIWNWYLALERNHQSSRLLTVRLFPVSPKICEKQPPFARFIVRVSVPGPSQKLFTSEVNETKFQTCKEFSWSIECSSANFIIDVEFLDLKICSVNVGEDSLLWPGDGAWIVESMAMQSNRRYLSRMMEEDIYTDVTINTSDGSLRVHKALLSACSPVFQSIFNHNLKEKESFTIYIEDMPLESCKAFFNYLYGNIKLVDFWKYRLVLLSAANKYEIIDLKDVCEESLLEDISSSNVLERLQAAWLYQLDKLKKRCLVFLFEFGKVYDVTEEMNNLFRQIDGELKLEMFQVVLHYLKTYMPASG